MKPSATQAFRIHGYEVRPSDRVILGPAGAAPVPAEAMDVLVRLAERPGETVPTSALGGNGALDGHIRELRLRLGGDGDSHRVIEAVGGDGYRLVAPVIPSDDIVLQTGSGPLHVRALDGDDDGDFLLDTDIGPVRLHPERNDAQARGLGGWLHRMREKRVFRALASYAVVSWLLLLVAIFAWTFQITPEGIVLDIGNGRTGAGARGRLARHFDLGVIALLLMLVAFLSWGRVFPTAPPDSRFALAVLPFENLSGDPADRGRWPRRISTSARSASGSASSTCSRVRCAARAT